MNAFTDRRSHPLGLLCAAGLSALITCLPLTAQGAADPGLMGPHPVSTESYTAADFVPPSFGTAVPVTARVHYPGDISSSLSPLPLIAVLHGWYPTCVEEGGRLPIANTDPGWSAMPCPSGYVPIHNDRGFDYLAQQLASHGYVVISIDAEALAAATDRLAEMHAELVDHHLQIWSAIARGESSLAIAPTFAGHLDLSRVGLVGHSMGGAGMARVARSADLPSDPPYGVRAVFLVAPQLTTPDAIRNVPLAVVVPYCDGDLSRLPGVRYFDSSRYADPGDAAPKHLFSFLGANHNYFSERYDPELRLVGEALGGDDWLSDPSAAPEEPCDRRSSERLTAAEQRDLFLPYAAAFFRTYLGRETGFAEILTGVAPPPPSAGTRAESHVLVTYHPPDVPAMRRDVNRLEGPADLSHNFLGGRATTSGAIVPYRTCHGSDCLTTSDASQGPHVTLDQLEIGWSGTTARYQNELPAGTRDLRGFAALRFRVAVSFEDSRNSVGAMQDFSVALTDGRGGRSTVAVGSYGGLALMYPPGSGGLGTIHALPRLLSNGVRIPLRDFTGVDKSDIRELSFSFDRVSEGDLFLTDIAFTNDTIPRPPAGPDRYDVVSPFNDEIATATPIGTLSRTDAGLLPGLLGSGPGPGDDRLLWGARERELTLDDAEDKDFFSFVLPDPARAYPSVEPVPDPECGAVTIETRWFDGSLVTDMVTFRSTLAASRSMQPPRDNEPVIVYHDANADGMYDRTERRTGTSSVVVPCPRSAHGMVGELLASIGERDGRRVFPDYDLSINYTVDVHRAAGVPDWVRSVIQAREMAHLDCPGGAFPNCPLLHGKPGSFPASHPQIPAPLGPCPAPDDRCSEYLAFEWEGSGQLDLRFFAPLTVRFELLDGLGKTIAVAVPGQQIPPPTDNLPPPQAPLRAASSAGIPGASLVLGASAGDGAVEQLMIANPPAGFYLLRVIGPATDYDVVYAPPPPPLDMDLDEVPDVFDLCPQQAEDVDGFRDLDGCPDPRVRLLAGHKKHRYRVRKKAKKSIRVAVLSSHEIDATGIEAASVEFGDGRARPLGLATRIKDANHDGLPDLFMRFLLRDIDPRCGEEKQVLSGMISATRAVHGAIEFEIKGCSDEDEEDTQSR